METISDDRKSWVREVILRGDDPVKRFRQASAKEQTYGLLVVSREAMSSARLATGSGGLGAGFLIGSTLWPGMPTAFMGFGVLLLLTGLIAAIWHQPRRRALRRLADARALTPWQHALVARYRPKWQPTPAP